MKRKLSTLFTLLSLTAIGLYGQESAPQKGEQIITFYFIPGDDMFYIPYGSNDVKLTKLCSLIDEYRNEITSDCRPVRVNSYCASLPSTRKNLRTARLRANRVKSELITKKGMTEADFITAVYASAYKNDKDVVVVTLYIPAKTDPSVIPTDSAILSNAKNPAGLDEVNLPPQDNAPGKDKMRKPTTTVEKQPENRPSSSENSSVSDLKMKKKSGNTEGDKPYTFALRTNLLYDIFLLPTLGVEWRINRCVGIRLDGSLSRWGGSTGKVQKIWLLSPEVRRYLLANHRFYVGVSGNYGEYNIYKYMIGGLMKDDTGYQGHLWSAGLAVGYRLPLWRCISADFNLGLGYTRSKYDSFTVTDGRRIVKQHNRKKNLWGPTQASINLTWTIGRNE